MTERISKEQWQQIAAELQHSFCRVQFKYQDTVISIVRERSSESRTALTVYFDGQWCMGWGLQDSGNFNPLTRLFWCEKKRRHYSFSYWVPCFSTSTSLIRQFKKADGLSWVHPDEVQ